VMNCDFLFVSMRLGWNDGCLSHSGDPIMTNFKFRQPDKCIFPDVEFVRGNTLISDEIFCDNIQAQSTGHDSQSMDGMIFYCSSIVIVHGF
jgi:hypothetical protein